MQYKTRTILYWANSTTSNAQQLMETSLKQNCKFNCVSDSLMQN